jgi:hypothetical protein
LILGFALFFFGFNLLSLFLGRTFLLVHISSSEPTQFRHVSRWSQPFLFYICGPMKSTSIELEAPDGHRKTATTLGSFYRLWNSRKEFLFRFHSSQKQPDFSVKLRDPSIGLFLFFLKLVVLALSLLCAVVSYRVPLLRTIFQCNVFASLYAFCRILHLSPFVDMITLPTFWAAYLYLILSQSRVLYWSVGWLVPTVKAIVLGTTFSLFIGLFEPSVAPFMGIVWLFIPALAAYLFRIGRLVVQPGLLALHFGTFVIVSGSIFFSALSRGFHRPTELGLLNETIDLTAVVAFAVLQVVYVIGDRASTRLPDMSLGKVPRVGKVNNMLTVLVAREEREMQATFE